MHKLISSGVQVKAMEQRLRSADCGQRAAVSGILHMQKQKIMTDRCRERAKEWRGGAGGGGPGGDGVCRVVGVVSWPSAATIYLAVSLFLLLLLSYLLSVVLPLSGPMRRMSNF